MKYLNTLSEGMHISEVYLCKDNQIMLTKAGKEYGSCVLQDKTATLDGKIWTLSSPGIGNYDKYDYVAIEADVTAFNGSLQLNIKKIRKADEGEYVPADYLPVSSQNPDQLLDDLMKEIDSVKQKPLNTLLKMIFVEDKEFISKFKFSSAAKSVHHGFVGGLMEHSVSVAKLCEFYCTRYADLNHDLLITAALCHDIGKVKELSVFPENDYTDEGQLLGHIVMGIEMIGEKIKEIPDFPVKLATELKHCIAAHHGELEYGSPKKPALIEALALNLADNTDAKMETMKELLDAAGDNNGWLGYNRFIESNYRKTSV